MRRTQTCPKCGGKRFFLIEQATVPRPNTVDEARPLTLATAWLPTGKKGLLGSDHARYEASLQAAACATCGHVELSVTADSLRVLAYMMKNGAATVQYVDATAGTG